MSQTTLDFWVVTTPKEQKQGLTKTWLTYQPKIDRLMVQVFNLYQKFGRRPYDGELVQEFTEDELITIQPYLLWLCPSLNFQEEGEKL